MIRTPDFFVPKSYVSLLSGTAHNILCFRVFFECSLKLNFTLFSYSPTLSVGFMWSLVKTRKKHQPKNTTKTFIFKHTIFKEKENQTQQFIFLLQSTHSNISCLTIHFTFCSIFLVESLAYFHNFLSIYIVYSFICYFWVKKQFPIIKS